jgi:hypothetical protein
LTCSALNVSALRRLLSLLEDILEKGGAAHQNYSGECLKQLGYNGHAVSAFPSCWRRFHELQQPMATEFSN